MFPRISIVTPSFNQGRYLEENILSVIHQGYANVEHIIIDGGSTDETKQVIEKYRNQLAYVVSEKDKGQSDAINKGYVKATGDIINWLNSDDYLAPQALSTIAKAFENPNVNVVAGCSIAFEEGGKQVMLSSTLNKKQDLAYHLRFPNINQPATYFRKSVMDKFMPLNTNLHYLMDRELWLKYLLQEGIKNTIALDDALVYFRLHGESKSVSQEEKFDTEYATMLYHIAKHHNLNEIAELLVIRFGLVKEYAPSFSSYPDKETMLNMLRFFVVKRGSLVFHKPQFEFAKAAYSLLDIAHYKPYPEEEKGMERIKIIAGCLGWLHFRAKRKWNHMIPLK